MASPSNGNQRKSLKSSTSDTDLAGSAAAAVAAAAAQAGLTNNGNHNNHHHSTVIPAYPYNVSASPFIPGSSNRSEQYFDQHVPDDSNVQTRLPSICVDYLSHDWQEDDVWTSWKAMTKHKSEIANGVRLENASWRTWAKQRGKLKTISPETLNWLKDSDVTWLYGPLHTAVDPVPPPKKASAEERLGLTGVTPRKGKSAETTKARSYSTTSSSSSGHHGVPLHVKPILKHRSLSDILSVPGSGAGSPTTESLHSGDGEEEDDQVYCSSTSSAGSSAEGTPRGDGTQTPTTVAGKGGRPTASKLPSDSTQRRSSLHPSSHSSSASSPASSLGNDHSGDPAYHDLPTVGSKPSFRRASSHEHPQKKRHITFNHRVEQCISVDYEEPNSGNDSGANLAGKGGKQPYSNALQRYGSQGRNSASSSSSSSSASSSDDDDDEGALMFRSSSPKSPNSMRAFLPSPTGADHNAAGGPGTKIPYGTNGPHGQPPAEHHTIAKLAPTTLRENDLMPGPTPIVVFEDGRVTALYGTEADYVYDAEEHGGLPRWIGPASGPDGQMAMADELSDRLMSSNLGTDSQRESVGEPTDLPTSKGPEGMDASAGTQAADDSIADIHVVGGQIAEPGLSEAATARPDYFAGGQTGLADEYDSQGTTQSQAKFGPVAPREDHLAPSDAIPMSNSSSSSGSEITLGGTASPNDHMLFSTSPSSGFRAPTKSILKKGKDPSLPGSADYYPPVPPASTRASRAHAQMFDENGDEIAQSPRRMGLNLGEPGEDGASSQAQSMYTSSNLSTQSGTSPMASPQAQYPGIGEPSRGRSISRGSSTSSLYERAQAAAASDRNRSASGGSSLSPAASYSPPHTSGINSLGTGTALMQTQPVDMHSKGRRIISGGGNIQAARPANRRTALSDSSSDDDNDNSSGDSSDDEERPDIDQATAMELNDDRTGETTMTQENHKGYSERRQLGQSSGTQKPGFDARPARAAAAGRVRIASPAASDLPRRKGTEAAYGGSYAASKNDDRGEAGGSQLNGGQVFVDKKKQRQMDMAGEGFGLDEMDEGDDDDAEQGEGREIRLFDSPYMPSSPRIASASNLPGLASNSGQTSDAGKDPYLLSWADAPDNVKGKGTSTALVTKNKRTTQQSNSWFPRASFGQSQFKASEHKRPAARERRAPASDDDELSDPANNGYSYGFDDDEEDGKSAVPVPRELMPDVCGGE